MTMNGIVWALWGYSNVWPFFDIVFEKVRGYLQR